ncbi:toxin glutamine deamidase domain-containing protein [Kitasatospora sp. McL0602]|uniref:toxin glutamine deamidase domain-containing protein n=1 Tax=Kitasatospora sp. McL0602 TaxID=3439530 RepID=UPI003F8B5914
MATELPEPLQWVLLLLAGCRWPEQDEGQLREMADHWRKTADGVEHAAQAADSAMKNALDGQKGGAAEALATHWAQFTTGKGTEQDPGYFPGTIQACRGMGDMLESMANSAETAKITIIAQLGILAFEIATAEAASIPTAGASLLEIPVAITTGRTAVMAALKKLAQEAVMHALKMGIQMGAINLLAQSIELAEGHRKSIDTKELGDAVKGGAISGAAGHVLGKGLGAAGGKLLPKGAMESLPGKMAHGAATGVGTDAFTQFALTGKVDTSTLLGSGLSGGAGPGLHAGAAAAREHFNGPPKFAPEGGIGAPTEHGSGGRQDGPPSSSSSEGGIGDPVPSGSGGRQDGPPSSSSGSGSGIGDPVPSGSGGRQDGPPSSSRSGSSDNSTYHGPESSSSSSGEGSGRPSLAPFGSDRPSGSGSSSHADSGSGSGSGSGRPSAHESSSSHLDEAPAPVTHESRTSADTPRPTEGSSSQPHENAAAKPQFHEAPAHQTPSEPARETPLEPMTGETPRPHSPSVEPLPHEEPSGRVGEEPSPRVPSEPARETPLEPMTGETPRPHSPSVEPLPHEEPSGRVGEEPSPRVPSEPARETPLEPMTGETPRPHSPSVEPLPHEEPSGRVGEEPSPRVPSEPARETPLEPMTGETPRPHSPSVEPLPHEEPSGRVGEEPSPRVPSEPARETPLEPMTGEAPSPRVPSVEPQPHESVPSQSSSHEPSPHEPSYAPAGGGSGGPAPAAHSAVPNLNIPGGAHLSTGGGTPSAGNTHLDGTRMATTAAPRPAGTPGDNFTATPDGSVHPAGDAPANNTGPAPIPPQFGPVHGSGPAGAGGGSRPAPRPEGAAPRPESSVPQPRPEARTEARPEAGGSRFRTQEQRQRQQEREQRQHEFATREHTTPETPVEPKRDVPTMGQEERLHALGNLTPEDRRSLATDKDFVADLRRNSTPDQFAESAAHLLVHVDPRTEQGGAARHEAHQQLTRMLRDPDVAERLLNEGVEVVVVPKDVRMTDMPGFERYKGSGVDGDAGQGRGLDEARGVTGNKKVMITEENLLGEKTSIGSDPNHPDGYSTTTHEIAHAIQKYGLSEGQKQGIIDAFNEKKARPDTDPENPVQWPDGSRPTVDGVRQDNYSSTDREEYFAQATNSYLSTNHGRDFLTGENRNNGAHWAGGHEQALHPLMEQLYGKDPLAAHTGGRANPVDHIEAVSGVGDFFRMAEGAPHETPASHETPAPHEEQPHQAQPHDEKRSPETDPVHDDLSLAPSVKAADPAKAADPDADAGDYSHKIDGKKTIDTIKDFLGDSDKSKNEFEKVRTEIEKYDRADLEDADTAAMLGSYRQQKRMHVDLLSRNEREFTTEATRLQDKSAQLESDLRGSDLSPKDRAQLGAEKVHADAALSRIQGQQDRMAIFDHEYLKKTQPNSPELPARERARQDAERRILPEAIRRIKVKEAEVAELQKQAEAHKDAALKNKEKVGVYNDRLADLKLRREELAADRKQREDDLAAAEKAPRSPAPPAPAGGPRRGGVSEPTGKTAKLEREAWKKLDDSYRKAFGYSDHGVMAQEPHAEKLVVRSGDKSELAKAKINRNHVIADYMVHKYVTAAVFKARAMDPEAHGAASEAFGDFVTDMAPDRHRIYGKFGAEADKRLAMGGHEEAASVRRDLNFNETTVDLGTTYGRDLGKAFDKAGVADHQSAANAHAELEHQLGRSGLDMVARPELDALAKAVGDMHAAPAHPAQIKAVHDAIGNVEQKVKKQAVEDLALVNGVTGPRLLDDTAASLAREGNNSQQSTPASRKRLAGQLDDLAARYEKAGANPNELKAYANDLRSDHPTVTPDHLKQLAAKLPGDRAALRDAEVNQRLHEVANSAGPERKLEAATNDLNKATKNEAKRQKELADAPKAVADAEAALGLAEKKAESTKAAADVEAKKKAADVLVSARKKLAEAPGKLADAQRDVAIATEAKNRVNDVYHEALNSQTGTKDPKEAARVAWSVADHELVGKEYGGAFPRAKAGENHPAGMFEHALTAKVEEVPGLIEDITAKLSNSASNLRFGDETVNKWIQNFLDPHLVRDPEVVTAVAHGQLPGEALYSSHTADLLQAVHSLEQHGLAPKGLRDIMAPKTQGDMENVLSSTDKKASPSATSIGDELHIQEDKSSALPVSSSGEFSNRPARMPGSLPDGHGALPKPIRDPQAGTGVGGLKRDVTMADVSDGVTDRDGDTQMGSQPDRKRQQLGSQDMDLGLGDMSLAPSVARPATARPSGDAPRGSDSVQPSHEQQASPQPVHEDLPSTGPEETHLDGTRTASSAAPRPAGTPGDILTGAPDDIHTPPAGADPRTNSGAQIPPQFGPVTSTGPASHGSTGGGHTGAPSAPRPEPTAPRPATPGGGRGAGDHVTEPSGSNFRTPEQRQHESNTREHATPEIPVEPKRDVPTVGHQHDTSPQPHEGQPHEGQPHEAQPHQQTPEHAGTPLPMATEKRPIGGPGGLEEPSHSDHERIEGAVPHNADGSPQRHPDPNAGDWIKNLNGDGPDAPGRNNNCTDAALALVDTYGGRPTPAAARTQDLDAHGNSSPDGEHGGRVRIEQALGGKFEDLGDGRSAYDKLSKTLLDEGHGSQAVIISTDRDGRSHAWNAVNHNGKVVYLDAQSGLKSHEPLHNGDHGVFAIPLTPDRNPVHPTDPNAAHPTEGRQAPDEPAGLEEDRKKALRDEEVRQALLDSQGTAGREIDAKLKRLQMTQRGGKGPGGYYCRFEPVDVTGATPEAAKQMAVDAASKLAQDVKKKWANSTATGPGCVGAALYKGNTVKVFKVPEDPAVPKPTGWGQPMRTMVEERRTVPEYSLTTTSSTKGIEGRGSAPNAHPILIDSYDRNANGNENTDGKCAEVAMLSEMLDKIDPSIRGDYSAGGSRKAAALTRARAILLDTSVYTVDSSSGAQGAPYLPPCANCGPVLAEFGVNLLSGGS